MPTEPEIIEHQREFLDWLAALRNPVKHGVVPSLIRTLDGYSKARNEFRAGGKFDAVSADEPFIDQNQQFEASFTRLMQILNHEFDMPAPSMTVPGMFRYALECLYEIERYQPKTFGIQLPEENQEEPPPFPSEEA